MKMKTQQPQTLINNNENENHNNKIRHCKRIGKGKVHSNTGLPQET